METDTSQIIQDEIIGNPNLEEITGPSQKENKMENFKQEDYGSSNLIEELVGNFYDNNEEPEEIRGPSTIPSTNINYNNDNIGYQANQNENQVNGESVVNNLINMISDPDFSTLKPIVRTTKTMTRTTTVYVAPTYVNNNSYNNNNGYNNHNNNNGYSNHNNNGYSNQNNRNTNYNNNRNNNYNNQNTNNQASTNRGIPNRGASNNNNYPNTTNRGPSNQNKNINNPIINQNQIQDQNLNKNQNQSPNGGVSGITNPDLNITPGQFDSNANPIGQDQPEIVPDASGYGYASKDTNIESGGSNDNNNNIENNLKNVENSANPSNKNSEGTGSNYTFVIILITVPLLIIMVIAGLYYYKKYKKRKSNIVYPDEKIRKSNLFGTLQFWNSNKINRVSVSTGSRNSRTNLTSLSNEKEESTHVPEYSEWLEAGSNTLSMPPVSPPPLVTDGKVNGLTGSNYAMGVALNNELNRNSGLNGQVNRPPIAKNAWKLEGLRVNRDSQRKSGSTRQSLFNSYQVW
jgi:hypothetical protein